MCWGLLVKHLERSAMKQNEKVVRCFHSLTSKSRVGYFALRAFHLEFKIQCRFNVYTCNFGAFDPKCLNIRFHHYFVNWSLQTMTMQTSTISSLFYLALNLSTLGFEVHFDSHSYHYCFPPLFRAGRWSPIMTPFHQGRSSV